MSGKATKGNGKAAGPKPDKAFQIKITLRYIHPPIWRRVLVEDTSTLGELHRVIQRVMGWGGGHLHEFRMPPRGFGAPLRRFGHEGEDEDATLLRDVFVRQRQVLLYEYDFGDGWLHELLLEKMLPIETPPRYPVCLAGARACPPDDCGGPPGYEQLLDALVHPTKRGSAEMLDWCGDFKPEEFDVQSVNRSLGR